MPSGANAGSSSGGGSPTGSAGGSLTGTYPNPTIATIPSGATATTQTAADGSTKVATTAYVDTADALKANLASPTFSGTPSLPTGTTATTQSAADSSTKLATTAFATTADNLLAPLASPTFSGTPTLPTGTILTTQSIGDSTTKPASTAFVAANVNVGMAFQIAPNMYGSIHPCAAGSASTVAANGDSKWFRAVMAKSGTLHDVSFLTVVSSGNYNILVLDDGQANGTHTVRTCLYVKGSTAVPSTGTWMTGDAALNVVAGDTLILLLSFDNTTASMATAAVTAQTGAGSLPSSSFFPGSGASTTTQKVVGTCLSANVPASVSSTVTDANMVAASKLPLVVWRIT